MPVNRLGLVLGRILISAIFVISGAQQVTHFSTGASSMRQAGLPMASVLLAISIAIELGAGLLLLTGFKARYAALLLAAWLVPVTLVFHNFWAYSGAEQHGQAIHFLKNLAILGGLLCFSMSSAPASEPQTAR